MGFLNPILLALGAAVAVPLILHLIHRQHGRRVVFPALRYLRRAEKENARRIRLRQLLLLALRVGAVALLAMAAARPFLRSTGVQHRPTAAVIVLDNSLSSGMVVDETRVLDLLKERALETLALAGPDDRFWLIRAATPWEPAVPGTADETARRVRETRVVAAAADLGAAVDRARSLLAAGAEGRAAEIHLLSDLQANGFRAALPAEGDGPPVIAWSPDVEPPANNAVTALEVGGGLPPLANDGSTVTATIEGTGETDSVTVRLAVDGRITSADVVPVGASAVLRFPARSAGLVPGWVEIDPDALRGDDRRYFVVSVRPPPRVALDRALPFVDEALDVLRDAGRIRRSGRGEADVLLAPAAAGVEAVRRGRAAVILAPAAPVELPAANRRLAEAGLPWRFEPTDARGEARFALPEGVAPVLKPLADVRLRQSYRLVQDGAAPADSVLLRLGDGSPWAVRGALPDGGRYVILASPLTTEASTLPTSPAMLPLLDRLVGAWTADGGQRTEARPGQVVALPAEAETVERPDGVRDRVEPGVPYVAPAQPGIYRVRAGDRVVSAFAVNPPASESAMERLDDRRLASLLPGWSLRLTEDPGEWAEAVYHERLGREFWRPLLLMALAVLLIEGLVAAAGGTAARRRPSTPGAGPARRPVAATGTAGGEGS